MSTLENLWKKAKAAQLQAYAPYSNFPVGAVLIDENGNEYVGCNVENATFGLTICAERSAVCAMISAGAKKIKQIVIVTNTPGGCPPCGLCLQTLIEFSADPSAVNIHLGDPQKLTRSHQLSELMPYAFKPSDIE